jgi:hypothetical protein
MHIVRRRGRIDEYGRAGVLINNAGVLLADGETWDESIRDGSWRPAGRSRFPVTG